VVKGPIEAMMDGTSSRARVPRSWSIRIHLAFGQMTAWVFHSFHKLEGLMGNVLVDHGTNSIRKEVPFLYVFF